MHEPGVLILWFIFGALAVAGLGAGFRWLSTPERRARRVLRPALGGRPDLILTGADGAAAGLQIDRETIALRRSHRHPPETFALDDLLGAELVSDGQVVARCWRGEPRRALDRTPEAPARLDLRLAFAHRAAAEIVITAWDASERRSEAERDGAVEAARRWFAQMDAIVRTPRRPAAAEGRDAPGLED